MNENYKIVSKFIKDISGETPDVETYLYVKDFIPKYQLNIEINSKPLKAQIIEVNTLLKFHDTSESKKKSHFEMTYTSVIKLNEKIKDKKVVEIYLFIKIGGQIGAFNTISLIFITAIIGVFYARYEGLNTLRSGFSQLIKNEAPIYELSLIHI